MATHEAGAMTQAAVREPMKIFLSSDSVECSVEKVSIAQRSLSTPTKDAFSSLATDSYIMDSVEGGKTSKQTDSDRALVALVIQKAALAREVDNARLAYQAAYWRLRAYDVESQPGISIANTFGFEDDLWLPKNTCVDAMMQMPADKTTSQSESKSKKKSKLKQQKKVSFSDSGSSAGDSTATGPDSTCSSQAGDDLDRSHVKPTTVMMRNIPNSYNRNQLLELLGEQGWEGLYDLVYVPIDYKQKAGLGYAFINLVDHDTAESFRQSFQGFASWNVQSEKVCQLSWSDALQGLEAHVEKYRNAFVMHESVDDVFRPALFKDGERIPFPEPTKKIRVPKPWSRRR